MAPTQVEIPSPGGGVLRATLSERTGGAGRAPAVVLVADSDGAHAREVLAAAGFTLLAPRPADGASWSAQPDRRALAELECALAWLAARDDVDGRRLAAVGSGRGGTLAYLLGCTSRRVAAVVASRAAVVYPALDASRPTQPLELALNLSAPLLVIGPEDEHSAQFRRRLEQGGKHVEFVAEDRDGSRALAFLRAALDDDGE